MALDIIGQINNTLDKSNNILITFKKQHNADSIASALALKLLLEKKNKKADIVSDSFSLDAKYKFLPESHTINTTLESLKQFSIFLNTKETQVKNLSYTNEEDILKILITPKNGEFAQTDISSHNGDYMYDLIITLDTEDLESLGDVYEKNQDFFYKTTIMNLDHKPDNDHYGQINHVDLNVTSVSELIYKYIETHDNKETLIDSKISQCLLCGIIDKTKSFKSIQVTPITLNIASRLMHSGADRDVIVKNLYYTKSITTLKLWGKVLSRLKADEKRKIVWSYLEQKDFDELETSPEKLIDVIDELILTSPDARIITLFYEQKNIIHGIIYSDTSHSSKELVKDYNPFGTTRLATFKMKDRMLLEASQEVLTKIKENVNKY